MAIHWVGTLVLEGFQISKQRNSMMNKSQKSLHCAVEGNGRPNTVCENQTINVIFCECEILIVANWRYDKIEYKSKGFRL